jgi:hypothetical protein
VWGGHEGSLLLWILMLAGLDLGGGGYGAAACRGRGRAGAGVMGW